MDSDSSARPTEETLAKWYRQAEWVRSYLSDLFGGPVTITVDWNNEGEAFWERCRIEARQRELFGEVIGKRTQRPAHWRPRKAQPVTQGQADPPREAAEKAQPQKRLF